MVKMSTKFSNSGIHVAAYFGMVNPIKQLINNGADVNYRNEDGNTPLIATILGNGNRYQKREILDYLLSNGADVNIVNNRGETALHLTVRAVNACSISSKFLQYLLDCGADTTIKNGSGLTPSQLAFQLGNIKLGDALLCHDGFSSISLKNKSNLRLLFQDMFSCVFPVLAFRLQLRKDLAKITHCLPCRNSLREKKDIEISSPIVHPGQPSDGCKESTQLPQQTNMNLIDGYEHVEENHVSRSQTPCNKNQIYAEKNNENIEQPGQLCSQIPAQPPCGNVYTVETPIGLPIEDKFRKQLNIHQLPPF